MTTLRLNHLIFGAALLLTLTAFGCGRDSGSAKDKLTVTTPVQTDDGWFTENAAGAGLDTARLVNLLRRIDEKEYRGVDGILIVRDNRLVFEKYFSGYDFEYTSKDLKGRFTHYERNTMHNLASVTKSVTGILCGIAIDRGLIYGVDDKIQPYFPDYAAFFTGGKENITIAELLTMSSGLKWNEQEVPYTNESNDIIQLFIRHDPVGYILSKPLSSEPGTRWYYNGGGTNLIGQIIQRRSEIRLDRFAKKYLFDPLGIKQYKWVYINPDFVYCSGDLRLRPRDMAKLGELVLDKGVWNGKRIVSAGWTERMTTKYVHMPHDEGYGYQWWLQKYRLGADSLDSYQASGWGGQKIIVLPELQSVVVITGNNYTRRDPGNDMMYNYILPSIDGEFSYDTREIEKAAPLPGDTRMTKPAAVIPASIAALSGHWYGEWEGNVQPCQLVVEKIDSGRATVVYSWADLPYAHIAKGWVRKNVPVVSSGAFRIVLGDTLKFRYDPVEGVILGNMKNKYISIKNVLRRGE